MTLETVAETPKIGSCLQSPHTCGWQGRVEVAPGSLLCTRGEFGSDKAGSSH